MSITSRYPAYIGGYWPVTNQYLIGGGGYELGSCEYRWLPVSNHPIFYRGGRYQLVSRWVPDGNQPITIDWPVS
ncbi:hypothetical protein TIFTF001_041504 [Ficus carica]|uniref:Uncharacterized protein n=1 Tax=Ficus carica TaxID=3494 RepID=A0AA88D980_FICCA|nr:hypothetical protein TIFTF001_041504 [Ficus carica]